MEWVFRDYGRYLNQVKDPIPPRGDAVGFDVINDAKELDHNLKLQVCPSEI